MKIRLVHFSLFMSALLLTDVHRIVVLFHERETTAAICGDSHRSTRDETKPRFRVRDK